jgi:diguanylate cyclase (GGDEF)-like protein
MTRSSFANALENKNFRSTFLLVLIIAGLAGNYFSFPIFLNIDFLFGSIFALLALQFFGLGRGILAAAIISCYTYFLWNIPYAILIMSAEVSVVGWLFWRRKMGMVLADTLFWLILGMPMAYLFFHLVMQVPASNTFIIMTKLSVNGIANALIARLIFTLYAIRLRTSITSYREIVYNLLAFFVLCPTLIMMAIGSRTDFNETDHQIHESLMQDSRSMTAIVEIWVENRRSTILMLAEMAAQQSPLDMQPRLEQANQSDTNFSLVALLDQEATTVAYSPLIDELGQSSLGKNFADRPYLPLLKRTLKPMLTEVALSRVGIPKPHVRMIAPVVISGKYSGYVSGVLNLDQVERLLDKSTDQKKTLYTLLDRAGNVIMTNRSDQTVMRPFTRDKGTLYLREKQLSQWIPAISVNEHISERWQKSFYVVETGIGNQSEWRLILEQPVAPFQKQLYDRYTGKLTLLFLILLSALLLAEFLSRKLIVTLGKLRTLTNELPLRLATDCKDIVWPESSIQEASHLIINFREMADSLSEMFIETKLINESLEQRVAERTEELLESKKFTINVMDSLSSNIAVLDSHGIIVAVNEPWLRFSRENRDPSKSTIDIGKNYLDVCRHSIDSGDVEAIAAYDGINSVLHGGEDFFRLEYPCNSPDEQRWFNMSVSRLSGSRQGIVVSHINITERKQLELELRQAKIAAESATETISQLARTDELTGLHNRRSFNEIFALALSAARRHGHPLSLISIDLDLFKAVNDTLGHSVGDLVLQEFSRLILKKVRDEDIAVRLGGEEFYILLSHTAIAAATALAERIRSNFEQNPGSASPLVMTASFGVVQLRNGEHGETLLNRADDALYRAKHEGRNRVIVDME